MKPDSSLIRDWLDKGRRPTGPKYSRDVLRRPDASPAPDPYRERVRELGALLRGVAAVENDPLAQTLLTEYADLFGEND